MAYKKTLAESGGDFIPEIVDLPAGFYIGGCTLSLEVFGSGIENLESGCSRSLDCVGSALDVSPLECRPRKERSQ